MTTRIVHGVGKLIEGHGSERGYGHVEVTLEPMEPGRRTSVHWDVTAGQIPLEQKSVIMSAAEQHLHVLGRKDLRVTIVFGTWLGDAMNNLYDVATRLAIDDALRKL